MSEEWISNLYPDGEWSSWDTFPTREEAIDYGREQYRDALVGKGTELFNDVDKEDLKSIKSFYVARVVKFAPTVNAEIVLDTIQEEACDRCGEYAEDCLDCIPKDHVNDLQESLQKAFDDWLIRTGNSTTFFNCVDTEEVHIEPKTDCEYGNVLHG